MPTLSPREIAALLPMPELLVALGFVVNERTHRAPCWLHAGQNPTAFSWRDDGRWHCFSCGLGGGKIGLVRAAKNCGFREAVKFLAALAGVQPGRVSGQQIPREKRERAALENDARTLLTIEKRAWREAQDVVLSLEKIRRDAGRRLKEILRGSPERWSAEAERCWAALAEVAGQMPRAAAAYALTSFAPRAERLRFARDATARQEMIAAALDAGFINTDSGYRIEIVL